MIENQDSNKSFIFKFISFNKKDYKQLFQFLEDLFKYLLGEGLEIKHFKSLIVNAYSKLPNVILNQNILIKNDP